jgi:phosphatidylinositol alpha-1,6-mannosyltransferase
MTRLRVLLITPDFPPRRGGIQLVAHRLVTHFSCATSQVLTLDSGGARPWDAARPDIAVHRVRAGNDHRLAVLRLNATAVMAARSFRPDVVLVMHIVAAPAAAAIRRALGTPIITYLHAKEVPTRPRLARFAVRNSHRIVAVSRHTASLAAGAGADMSRVTVIPPGVDWHGPPREPRLTTPTVVTVARLEDRYKGHDVMVRAMALVREGLSDAQWLVVGDGPLRCAIERLATVEGVRGAIRLCGTVSDEARDQLLDRAHVFAMPSRVPANGGGDGFGIVYLEAGVHELPVIAGRIGGAQDAVIDGTTGLLVDPTDHVQVAAAISRLLLDRASAARMGAAGRERARAFTWPRIASRVEELMAETATRA